MYRLVLCLVAVLAALGLVVPAASSAPSPSQPELRREATITLVTGHVVRMSSRGAATLLNPDGSAVDGFTGFIEKGDLFLIPHQARPYLASGVLDRQLFNITDLIEQGFAGKPLPLIITYRGMRAQRAPAAAATVRELPSINGIAVSVGNATEFWGSATALSGEIDKIWLDARASVSLDESVPQVGAPAAWQQGFDGTGVTVAVLDTGVDAKHPDLAGKVVEEQNFSTSPTVEDKQGHGTHVAATVAGTGAASGGARKGVAPGAKIINGKVLDENGGGSLSAIIAGMEWAASRAQVVSMSLGAESGNNDGTDPMSRAVNALTASTGALFVVAAGNHPPGRPAVSTPAVADAALAVGAVDRADALAPFSNYGPRDGDSAIKPDITAPGVGIGAARAAGTTIGEVIDDHYTRLSGTSMATPHVSGAAAILAQRNKSWRAADLKSALMATAKPTNGLTAYQQGTGRLDVASAVSNPVGVDQTNLSLGRFSGPYGSLPPVERTLTYRSTEPVTLDLAVTGRATDSVRLSQSSLTIPGGGTATVTLTLDPNAGELGLYDGALVATPRGAGPAVRSAIGFHKDLRHTITVRATARDGRPATSPPQDPSFVSALNLATFESITLNLVDGKAELRVPPGEYLVAAAVQTLDASGQVPLDATKIVRDDVAVRGDLTLDLDARAGKEVRAKLAEDDTQPVFLIDFLTRTLGDGQSVMMTGYSRSVTRLYAVPMPPVRRGEFELTQWIQLRKPLLHMKVRGHDLTMQPRYLGRPTTTQPRLSGRRPLPVVFVGTGTPEEIARHDLTGKLALIEQSPAMRLEEQISNAAKAKAVAAAVYAAKPGRFPAEVDGDLPIPGVDLSHEDGRRIVELLKRDRVILDIQGTLVSPYFYDLVIPWRGGIPENLTIQPRNRDLAVVHNRYHAVRPGQVGMYGSEYSPVPRFPIRLLTALPFPAEQDRFFLPGRDLYQFAVDGENTGSMDSPDRQPEPGRSATVNWFKGPLAPGVTGGWPPASRTGDTLLLPVNEFVDTEPNHVYLGFAEQSAARIYRDGTLVAESQHAADFFEVGTEAPATYRVELDIHKGQPDWRLANRSSSAWTFRSARPADGATENLPLLRAKWDLDLDLNNTARDNCRFELRLRSDAAAISAASAWVSYDDGANWQKVELRPRGDGVFASSILHPKRSQTSGFVSLRFDVTDRAGNRFEQSLIRAYELR